MNSNLDPQQWGKSLFDAVTELVTTLDLNMRIQWANQDTAKSVNENPENLLGHYCFQVWYNRDIPCEECPVQMTIQTGESQESEVASPDGKYQHVRTYPLNSQEGNLEGVAVLGRDITEWKQMEKELQQRRSELEKQEELYRSLVEDHPYFVERFLPDTTIIFANNAMAESIGYPPEQLKGRKWIDFIPEEERTLILEQLAELTPEDSICSYENSCFASDGSKRLHSWTHQAFFDDQGEISYFQSVGTDVTERKQAERALQEWENYYRTIFETSGSAMFIIEHDTTISLANSNFERMTGYSRQEVEGKKSWTEFVHPDDVTWMKEKHYFRRQYPSGVPLEYEFRFFARNGELRHAYLTIDLIPETTKSVVSVVDITERKNTEAAMRRSENYYRAIFETSGAIMFIVEEDTTISHVNSNFENLTGYSRQEVEGEKSWTEFVNPGDLEWLQEYNYSLRQHPNTAPRQNEINITNRQGESKDLYLAAARIPGSNQRVVSCIDITESKRAEDLLRESEEQYRLLVENAFEGIGVAQDGEFKWINPRIVEMMGCSQEELTTISIFDFVHPEDKEAVIKKHYQRMQEIKPPRIYSFRILSPQNEVLWCQVSVIGINWQGRPADLCFFSDISQQKRIESELEEAKQRAEAANRSKSEFLANMSHEIRTPLNGILGMLQLLKTSALDEQQERFVDTGLDSTRRLNRLLTDILDLSKIEANKLVIKQEEFVFTDVIQTIRDIFNQLTQKNQNEINISLDENIPEMLIGDSTRLNQILFNLVGNANKYTQNGQIGLEVSLLPAVQPDNCRLLFVIADNGQGIPEDRIDRIFDIFTQGSDASYTREFEGAGLGLPLVKRLVDLMNGSISLSSKEGEGTTVYVSLPFGIPESMQQDTDDSQAAEKPFTASNSRVLVVDDDETTQLYIKRLLEMQGVATNVAEDGKEALDWLEKDDFDCILMDVQMPVLDGVEATKKIRSSNADFKKIPIVAMTAYAMTGDREKFLQAGMDDYIAKPVDRDGLLAILERNIN